MAIIGGESLAPVSETDKNGPDQKISVGACMDFGKSLLISQAVEGVYKSFSSKAYIGIGVSASSAMLAWGGTLPQWAYGVTGVAVIATVVSSFAANSFLKCNKIFGQALRAEIEKKDNLWKMFVADQDFKEEWTVKHVRAASVFLFYIDHAAFKRALSVFNEWKIETNREEIFEILEEETKDSVTTIRNNLKDKKDLRKKDVADVLLEVVNKNKLQP